MPKNKKEDKNPVEMLNDLIKETGTGFFKGFENFFDDLKFFIVLARSENSIQIIKHKSRQIFGVSFHPEVRNQKIIDNFLQI